MPIIKSAKKRLKIAKRNRALNLEYLEKIRKKTKEAKKEKNTTKRKKLIAEAYSIIDKAAKKRVIHKNKAKRLKSRLIKAVKEEKKPPKTKKSTKKKK